MTEFLNSVIDLNDMTELFDYAMVQKYAEVNNIQLVAFQDIYVLDSGARWDALDFDAVTVGFANSLVECACDATRTLHNILKHLFVDFIVEDSLYAKAGLFAGGMYRELVNYNGSYDDSLRNEYFLVLEGKKILNCWKAFITMWEAEHHIARVPPAGPWVFPLHIEESMFIYDDKCAIPGFKPAYLGTEDDRLIYLVPGLTVEDISSFRKASVNGRGMMYSTRIKSFNVDTSVLREVTFFDYIEKAAESLNTLWDYFNSNEGAINDFLSTAYGSRLLRSPALFYIHRALGGSELKDEYTANAVARIRGD